MGNLLGVVLCGGESRRMGRDKGLLETDGIPWAVRMGRKLAPWGIPVVYSINTKQCPDYAAIVSREQWVIDSMELPGPLNGVFSVHERYPAGDLLLQACDMQDMDEETIGNLIDTYRSGNDEFYVYQEGDFAQPFCAIYTAGGLTQAYASLRDKDLNDFSFQRLIRNGRTMRLPIGRAGAFRNYNSL